MPDARQNPLPIRWILGLSTGHDPSATVLEYGRIRSHILLERESRIRHDYGIERRVIELALKEAGINAGDIQLCALSATQQMPLLIKDRDYFDYAPAARNGYGIPVVPPFGFPVVGNGAIQIITSESWRGGPESLILIRGWKQGCLPAEQWVQNNTQNSLKLLKNRSFDPEKFPHWQIDEYLTPIFGPASWDRPFELAGLPGKIVEFRSELRRVPAQLYYPVIAQLAGRQMPGVFVAHHAAHAASSFYSSPFEDKALVVTWDGGCGADSGFIFETKSGQLMPIGPHYLEAGQFYDYTGGRIGFNSLGAAGKLMGLSSYGSPKLHGVLPVGTVKDWQDWREKLPEEQRYSSAYEAMVEALLRRAGELGYDLSPFGQADKVLSPVSSDVASAVQEQAQQALLKTVVLAKDGSERTGEKYDYLCLSGGVALNCPANTLIWSKAGFKDVHVEPHCEDGGLSIGAGQYVYHTLLGNPYKTGGRKISRYAMMGPNHSMAEIQTALTRYKDEVEWEACTHWTEAAARDLAADLVIGVYQGSSETGPRALGHRSILANPAFKKNWQRVNEIKGREPWRPLAPIVIDRAFAEWFSEGPPHSPFMLFTHKVRPDKRDKIPAVTHVDATARAQTVITEDGDIWPLIEAFEKITGLPVVLNTSFNGPREPLVEKPEEALEMLVRTKLDVVYLHSFRVARKKS